MSLVEVVQVDDQVSFRGSVETEIAEVGITADDRGDASRREMSDVLGHHDGGTAQETVRGGHHPSDPDRDQPVQPAFMRMHDLLNRIRTVRWCLPVTHRAARNLLAEADA